VRPAPRPELELLRWSRGAGMGGREEAGASTPALARRGKEDEELGRRSSRGHAHEGLG